MLRYFDLAEIIFKYKYITVLKKKMKNFAYKK